MADHSTIEWTDATWNPITGCTMVDAGCTNCYAMGLAGSRLNSHPSRAGLTRQTGGRHVWTGEVRLNEQWLDQPLRWSKPRMIFVCAHGDLFHEAVPDEWIDMVFVVMAMAPRHTFQVLTKRPERAARYLEDPRTAQRIFVAVKKGTKHDARLWPAGLRRNGDAGSMCPLPNVWLGTSISDQASADARIGHLLDAPAAVRFLSAEPLLGPVDLTRLDHKIFAATADALTGRWKWEGGPSRQETARLDWVIVGGESGRNARPMHPDWARGLRDQCHAAGVAFFFKQWGEWAPVDFGGDVRIGAEFRSDLGMIRAGKKCAGRLLDGREWNQMPQVHHG